MSVFVLGSCNGMWKVFEKRKKQTALDRHPINEFHREQALKNISTKSYIRIVVNIGFLKHH